MNEGREKDEQQVGGEKDKQRKREVEWRELKQGTDEHGAKR